MKVLYFGTVCGFEKYNSILTECKYKPSVATVVFETALLNGFKENDAEVEIHSFPMIPTFPSSKLLRFGGFTERLICGYECKWLNTLNLPYLKQLSRRLDGRKALKKWARKNGSSGVVLTYSIPPFLVKDVIRYKKKYHYKTVAVVPDLLRDMYINDNSRSFVAQLKQAYLKPALKLQGKYDGYVYLTDAMHNVVAPEKPYMVMEGIANIEAFDGVEVAEPCLRSVMYAGMLHEKYGIINLLDAFEAINDGETELWLFGEGTAVDEIKRRALVNPLIKYFGSVERSKILQYEKWASLLVNPRSTTEAFTKYSFPSKTIEYMLSGTPVLTTRLCGIPNEYFGYVFTADDNSVKTLSDALSAALSHTDSELSALGEKARRFIIENKNSKKQAARIIKFLNEV